jgi:MFS superfamily sulfate permease-like transporter
MILSLLRIVQHSYHPHTGVLVRDQKGEWRSRPVIPVIECDAGVVIYRFGAPLFYANSNRFSEEIRRIVAEAATPVRWLVIDAGPITRIDYTAARSVSALKQVLARDGVRFALAHVGSDLRADLDRHHLTEAVGPTMLFDTLREALAAIHRLN